MTMNFNTKLTGIVINIFEDGTGFELETPKGFITVQSKEIVKNAAAVVVFGWAYDSNSIQATIIEGV